jgi:hypothetical protein
MMLQLGLLSALAAQPIDPPIVYVKPEVAVERLKACGFAQVAVRDDEELQEDALAVSGITQASEKQLRCAAEVSLSSLMYVELPEPLNQKYQQLYWRMERDKGRRDARAWLERRGLLAKLPTYVEGQTDDLVFAHKIEAICGPKAKGAFVRDHGNMTINTGTIEHPTLDDETFMCLLNVSSAAGFKLGFVGHEYYEKK